MLMVLAATIINICHYYCHQIQLHIYIVKKVIMQMYEQPKHFGPGFRLYKEDIKAAASQNPERAKKKENKTTTEQIVSSAYISNHIHRRASGQNYHRINHDGFINSTIANTITRHMILKFLKNILLRGKTLAPNIA